MSTIDDLVAQASGMAALSAAQIQAAQSAMAFATAQAKLTAAEEAGNVAAREGAMAAIRQLQMSEALAGAKGREAKAASDAAALQKKADQDAAVAKKDATKAAEDAAKIQEQAEKDVAKAAQQKATTIKSAGDMAAGAIRGLASAAMAIANGPIPSAQQAMTGVGQVMGNVITGAADKAAEALSKLGPAGQIAAAAIQAVGAVAAATVGTLMTLAGLAIEVTQKIDLMRDRFAALAGSAAGGQAVQGVISKLSASLPFATSQVNAWAQSLLTAGLQGKELESALRAVAAAQALMGDEGAAAAQSMLSRLAMGGAAADKLMKDIQQGGRRSAVALLAMGLNMRDVAAAAGMSEAAFKHAHLSAEQMQAAIEKALAKKGAGPLADLMLTFPAILQKAKEGFLSLFSGLGPSVKELMKSVQGLFGEFNKGSPLIKGLKPVVTDVLSTVFSWLKKGVDAVRMLIAGFMGAKSAKGPFAEIGAAIHLVWDAAKGLFVSLQNLNKGSPSGLSTALSVLVFIVKAAAGGIAMMIDNAIMAIAILSALGDVVSQAVEALSGLASGATDAAAGFVSGLVDGISAGAGAIVAAVSGLASSALGAFKGALGIASPSKVMMEMGGHTATGFAQGVDEGAGEAQASMDAMVSPKAGKGGAKGGGGPTFNFTGCTFGGDLTVSKLRAMMTTVFEMMASEGPGKAAT